MGCVVGRLGVSGWEVGLGGGVCSWEVGGFWLGGGGLSHAEGGGRKREREGGKWGRGEGREKRDEDWEGAQGEEGVSLPPSIYKFITNNTRNSPHTYVCNYTFLYRSIY